MQLPSIEKERWILGLWWREGMERGPALADGNLGQALARCYTLGDNVEKNGHGTQLEPHGQCGPRELLD